MQDSVYTNGRFFGILLITGVMAGIVGKLCSLLLHSIEHLTWGSGGLAHHTLIQGASFTHPLFRFTMLVCAGLLAALSWSAIVLTGQIPRISQAMSGGRMPLLRTVWHAVTQIVVVAMGASAGREAAPREITSAFGSHIGYFFALSTSQRRMIVGCAAGAGLAAVYSIPFSGILFTLEVMLLSRTPRAIVSAIVVNVTAVLVASGGVFPQPFYSIPQLHPELSHMVWAVVCGPIIGMCAFFFRRAVRWAESHRPENLHVAWSLPSAFVAVGLLASLTPTVLGNGQAAAQTFFEADLLLNPGGLRASGDVDVRVFEWLGFDVSEFFHSASVLTVAGACGVVLLLTLTKACATVLTIRSGAWGGTLTPSLAVGAGVSALCALLWSVVWPSSSFAVFVMIGTAAFLGVSLSAPLTGVALLVEFTRIAPYELGAGVLVTVVLAQVCAAGCERMFTNRSGVRGLGQLAH